MRRFGEKTFIYILLTGKLFIKSEVFHLFPMVLLEPLSGQLAGGGFGESKTAPHRSGAWTSGRLDSVGLSTRAPTCHLASVAVTGSDTFHVAFRRQSDSTIYTHLHPTLLVGD